MTPSAATGGNGFLAANYNITYAPYNGTVSTAPLTVTATGPSKTYGTALTAGTSTANFTASATQNGETVTSVTLTPNAAGLSATTAAGAAYVVTPSAATGGNGFPAANYNVTYAPYNGTVSTAPLTVTATGPSKTYGTALTAGTSTANFTASATQNGETVTSVTLTPNAAGLSATTAAGAAYVVTPSAATGGNGFSAANYNVTYNAYNGTVSTAPLTVTATGPSKTYGTALTAGTSTANFTASATQNGETVTSVTLTPNAAGLSATTAAGAAYVVTPSAATGGNGFSAANYNVTYAPYNGTVSTAPLTVTATGPSKTYGTALTAGTSTANFTASATQNGETVTSVTLTPNAAGLSATTAAGAAYVVTPSAATGGNGFLAANYNVTYAPYNGTVSTAPLTVTATGPSKTYGTVLTAGPSTANFTASATQNGETVTSVTLTPNAAGLSATTAAGAAYVVTPSAATGGNGFLAANYNITYTPYNGTVSQAALTPTVTLNNMVYNGTTGPTTINTRSLSGIVGSDDVSLGTSGNVAAFSGKNVNSYTGISITGLSLSGTTAGNYQLSSTSTTASANITALGITGNFTAQNKVYDGNNTAGVLTRTLNGVLAGDVGNVSLTGGTATFADAQVGTGKTVTLTGATLTGTAAGNYSLTSVGTTTANITPLGITVAGITANDKVYDGGTSGAISSNSVVLSGVLVADAGQVALSTNGYVATFDSADVGTNIEVTVSGLSLTGVKAGDYALTAPTGLTAKIAQAAVTIVSGITANDKVYDGTQSATISSNNVVLGGVLPADAGGVTPQWTYVTATGTASSSTLYIYLQSAGDVYVDDIELVAGSVPETGTNVLSDGGFESGFPGPWTISTNLSDSALSTTIKHSGNASLHVVSTSGGTTESSAIWQTVSPALTADATYTLSFWYLQSTNGGPLTIRLSGSGIVATVNPAPPATGGVALSTNGYVATFASASAGSGIGVSVSGLSLTGAKAGDYVLTQPAGLNANITALGITGNFTAQSKVYDGNNTAGVLTRTLNGVLAGDVGQVSLTDGTATFADAQVGTGKTVTLAGSSLTGLAAGNYSLTSVGTTTADITALGITGNFTAQSKVYDGNNTAVVLTRTLNGVLAGDLGQRESDRRHGDVRRCAGGHGQDGDAGGVEPDRLGCGQLLADFGGDHDGEHHGAGDHGQLYGPEQGL